MAPGSLEMGAKVLVSWNLGSLFDLLTYLPVCPVFAWIWHPWLLRNASEIGIVYY